MDKSTKSNNFAGNDTPEPEITSIIRNLYRQRQMIKDDILNMNKNNSVLDRNCGVTFDPLHLIPGIAVFTDEESCRFLWDDDDDDEDEIDIGIDNERENGVENIIDEKTTSVKTNNIQEDNHAYSNHSEKSKDHDEIDVEIEDDIEMKIEIENLCQEYLQANPHLEQTLLLTSNILPLFDSHLNDTNNLQLQFQSKLQFQSESQSSEHEIKETTSEVVDKVEIEIGPRQVEEKENEKQKEQEQELLILESPPQQPLTVQTVELKTQIPQIEQLVTGGKESRRKLNAVKNVVEEYGNVNNTVLTSTDDKQLFVVKLVFNQVGKPVDESIGTIATAFGWSQDDAIRNVIEVFKMKVERDKKSKSKKKSKTSISCSDVTDASVIS